MRRQTRPSSRFTIAYAALVTDAERNHQIVTDILAVVGVGRTPLVLTSRKEHLERLLVGLSGIEHVITLKGGMSKKQRQAPLKNSLPFPMKFHG
jgi:hypothetical protein